MRIMLTKYGSKNRQEVMDSIGTKLNPIGYYWTAEIEIK